MPGHINLPFMVFREVHQGARAPARIGRKIFEVLARRGHSLPVIEGTSARPVRSFARRLHPFCPFLEEAPAEARTQARPRPHPGASLPLAEDRIGFMQAA